jgi:peptidyl-prolyl cis-trans isomerase C
MNYPNQPLNFSVQRKDNQMRVSRKVILLMVCAIAGTVFALGKPAKEEKMKVKEEAPAKEQTVVEEETTVTETEMPAAEEIKQEVKKEEMPAAEASPAEPKKPVVEAKPAEPAETKAPEMTESKDVAVTVNGNVITETEVDEKMAPILQRAAMRMDPNSIKMYKSRIRGQVLEGMIMEKLLDEQAAKAGITVTESDVNDKIAELTAKQGITAANLGSILQMQGISMEQFRSQMKKTITYEKLMETAAGGTDVNDADALAYYEENKADFNTPEQVQASHILIKVEPSATEEEKAAAKEKAEKLLEQVKGGADFAELAKENSDCPSKSKGGDLGYFGKGQMVKEFEDAAFGMQPGDVSDVVETQFGYHIIKLTDHKKAGLTPFADVKEDIIENLKQNKQRQVFTEYIKKLRTEANIVYPPGKEPEMMMPMGPAGSRQAAPPSE